MLAVVCAARPANAHSRMQQPSWPLATSSNPFEVGGVEVTERGEHIEARDAGGNEGENGALSVWDIAPRLQRRASATQNPESIVLESHMDGASLLAYLHENSKKNTFCGLTRATHLIHSAAIY